MSLHMMGSQRGMPTREREKAESRKINGLRHKSLLLIKSTCVASHRIANLTTVQHFYAIKRFTVKLTRCDERAELDDARRWELERVEVCLKLLPVATLHLANLRHYAVVCRTTYEGNKKPI